MIDSHQELKIPKQTSKEGHFLEQLQQTSFFDSGSEIPGSKLFASTFANLNDLKIIEQSQMEKMSPSACKFKECLIYLTEDAMFYESKVTKDN